MRRCLLRVVAAVQLPDYSLTAPTMVVLPSPQELVDDVCKAAQAYVDEAVAARGEVAMVCRLRSRRSSVTPERSCAARQTEPSCLSWATGAGGPSPARSSGRWGCIAYYTLAARSSSYVQTCRPVPNGGWDERLVMTAEPAAKSAPCASGSASALRWSTVPTPVKRAPAHRTLGIATSGPSSPAGPRCRIFPPPHPAADPSGPGQFSQRGDRVIPMVEHERGHQLVHRIGAQRPAPRGPRDGGRFVLRHDSMSSDVSMATTRAPHRTAQFVAAEPGARPASTTVWPASGCGAAATRSAAIRP